MKEIFKSFFVIIITFNIILSGCKKEVDKPEFIVTPTKPVIKVYDATDITESTARIKIEVESTGGYLIKQKALCIDEIPFEGNKASITHVGDLYQTQELLLSGLLPDKVYYYNAYVWTDMYLIYCDTKSFKTKGLNKCGEAAFHSNTPKTN